MPQPPKNLADFQSLGEIIQTLRGPGGCPWDQKQTHLTLTRYALEEVHEMIEAIDQPPGPAADQALCEELGDVLLQVVLHAVIAEERGAFHMADVIEGLAKKMVRRHPHVFGATAGEPITTDQVASNWREIKAKEKAASTQSAADRMFDLPKGLPAMMTAQKIGERVSHFDWANAEGVWGKVQEELAELREAMDKGAEDEQSHELGDVLFTLVQLARHLQLEAETALRRTNQRFEQRFRAMQTIAATEGLDFDRLATADLEKLWQQAKTLVAKGPAPI